MLAIFAIIVTVRSAGADRLEISTPLAPSVTAASQGVLFDGYITTSMQFGVDIGTGKLVPGGAGPETVQALRNIGAVFDKAGLSLNSSATACVLFVSELEANFNAASTAYKTFFPDEPHPARSPSGVHFLLEGATVAVQCWGYSGERVKIRPAHFFDDDFNSQGILVPLNLYTAGQVGADPVTGGMVTGGAANETRQAMANLATVFGTAFAAHSNALAGLAAHCDLVVANLSTNWPAVETEFARLFAVPPTVTVFGANPGFGAYVEAYCTGSPTDHLRTVITAAMSRVPAVASSTQAVLLRASEASTQTLLQTSAQIGVDPATGELVPGGAGPETTQALRNLHDVFSAAYFMTHPHPDVLLSTATLCTTLLVSSQDADAVEQSYSSFFRHGPGPLPTRITLVVASLPRAARVSIQCDGATTTSITDH
jgi:2-iminobutanoate/2-iminopropanoate deaminase